MKRLSTLTLQYYRTLLIYNITFTILCIFLIGLSSGANLVSLFFAKLTGFTGAVALHYYSAVKTYFYYRNAGLSIRRLYSYAYIIDVSVFITATILFNLCHHLF